MDWIEIFRCIFKFAAAYYIYDFVHFVSAHNVEAGFLLRGGAYIAIGDSWVVVGMVRLGPHYIALAGLRADRLITILTWSFFSSFAGIDHLQDGFEITRRRRTYRSFSVMINLSNLNTILLIKFLIVIKFVVSVSRRRQLHYWC